ncbi:LysR family transcriptional regulator [Rhodococcus koreensis]
MDLRALRYFLAVVDHRGVGRGAAALYVSQPSLSQTIRQLESELGVPLLDRSGPFAVPTVAGREFAGMARRVLGEADRARERVRQVSDLMVGRVVVATASTLSVYPLTPIVAALRRRHPGLEVHVVDGGTGTRVMEIISKNVAEMGVVDLPVDDPKWGVRALPPEEVVLASSNREMIQPVARSDLQFHDIGVPTTDADRLTELGALLSDAAVSARIRTAHRQLLWEVVTSGVASAAIGRFSAERILPNSGLRPLDPPMWRTPALVWRRGILSPAGEALRAAADVLDGGVDE